MSAREGVNWFVEIDWKKLSTNYGRATRMAFASPGDRLVCIAQRGRQWQVVVDGAPQKAYEDVGALNFSPDGKHIMYTANLSNKKTVAVVDGFESRAYDSILSAPNFGKEGTICFSGPSAPANSCGSASGR